MLTVAQLIKALQEVPNLDAVVESGARALPAATGEADTELWTSTAHGLQTGDQVRVVAATGGTGLPTAPFTAYADVASANTFTLEDAEGATLAFSTDVTASTIVTGISAVDVSAATSATPPADAPDAEGADPDPGIVVLEELA